MTSRSKDRPRAAGDTRYDRYVPHVIYAVMTETEEDPGLWACTCGMTIVGDVYTVAYHLSQTQWVVNEEPV